MSYWRRNSIVLKGWYIIDVNVPVTFLCVKGNHSWRWLSELLTTKMMGNKMGNTETSDGHKNSQILLFAEWSLTTNRFKVMHFQCLYFCLYWTWNKLKPQLKHRMWQKKKKCHWRGTQICKAGTLNVFLWTTAERSVKLLAHYNQLTEELSPDLAGILSSTAAIEHF